ncbi:MAG TPA: glycosyltransferase family 2 protein [Bacteroidetes bacterium]|nr:glycosyltransferase family 2 protein [Bacteroidota bacterium]
MSFKREHFSSADENEKQIATQEVIDALPDVPLVTFVIPMYNEEKNITKCLDSILAQDYPGDKIEVLVIDGYSTDQSRSKVIHCAKKHPNIKLLNNPYRKTPKSLNIGAQNASGDVVIILGAHTRIKKDFVSQNIAYMKMKKVKCVGGTQINTGDSYIQQAIGHTMSSIFGIMSAPYRYRKRESYVDTVVYAAYHRSLFDEIGYFDEETVISEDAEFNWRIRKAGYKIYFTPKIVSHYYPRPNLRKLMRQFFRYGILRVNVVKKHLDAIKFLHLIPATFVFLLTLTGIFSLFFHSAFPVFEGLIVVYGIFLVIASLYTGFRYGLKYLPVFPFVFAAMQISFGFGFLVGLFKSHE